MIWVVLECLFQASWKILLSWSRHNSSSSLELIFAVFKSQILEVMSSIKSFSWSLSFLIDCLVVAALSSWILTSIIRGMWSDSFLISGRILCWLNPMLLDRRKARSSIEFESFLLLAYLVGIHWMEEERSSPKLSAIVSRLSECSEWWEKKGSQSLSLMLKSPIMRKTLLRAGGVSYRTSKAHWCSCKYTLMRKSREWLL